MFEEEYIARYPGLCLLCSSRVCICPAIPSATIGRMAKELKISAEEHLFVSDKEKFQAAGAKAAHIVLERFGGYSAVIERLPFDRGDANSALVQLCLKMADAVEATNQRLAATLRGEAVRMGTNTSRAGSPSVRFDVKKLLTELWSGWRDLGEERQKEIKATGGLVEELGEVLNSIKVLFIAPNPGAELTLPTSSGPFARQSKRAQTPQRYSSMIYPRRE